MEPVVNPGPVVRTLLRLQDDHRSELVWKGLIPLGECMKPKRMDLAWSLFISHPPHHRVVDYLSSAGLYDVVKVGRIQYDRPLLTAMVERWRPESHCFHLPFGEATITLQDIQVMFGLRVDGLPVYVQDVGQRDHQWGGMLRALTGYNGDISGRSFVTITNLTNYLKDEIEADPILDHTPVGRVERIARLYMLVILGGILFPNISGNMISLRFLPFLDPISEVGNYSWGSAVLAYLYRSLCRSSFRDSSDLCGFLPLIQVWCWERMLPLQLGLNEPKDDDAALPYARRWTRGFDRKTETHHSLIPIRDQIDGMTEEQFLWTPYDAILHTLPQCCKIDHVLWTARVPMLCIEVAEYHVPDRVMRQFGQPQHIPQPPDWDPRHFHHDLRNRLDQQVLELLDRYADDWGNRHSSLVRPVLGAVPRDYTRWFLEHGRLLIGNPALQVLSAAGFVHTAGSSAAMLRGLHKMLNLSLEWQRDPAHTSCGHSLHSLVMQILNEARDPVPLGGPVFEGDPLYFSENDRGWGRSDGRGRGRRRAQARGRARDAVAHALLDEPSPTTRAGPHGKIGCPYHFV